jgi:hypothetical protein
LKVTAGVESVGSVNATKTERLFQKKKQSTRKRQQFLAQMAHRVQQWPNVYAIKAKSTVYHLVGNPPNVTLCGLPVTKVPSALALHVVRALPVAYTFCKHCERLKNISQKT